MGLLGACVAVGLGAGVAVFMAVDVPITVLVALTTRGAVVVPPGCASAATSALVSAKRQSAEANTTVHVRRWRGDAARQFSAKRESSPRMDSIGNRPHRPTTTSSRATTDARGKSNVSVRAVQPGREGWATSGSRAIQKGGRRGEAPTARQHLTARGAASINNIVVIKGVGYRCR